MSAPYRTPPPRAESPPSHACSDPSPACGPAAHDHLLGQLLREQISLQRKLLWIGRAAFAASVVPWVILGTTLYDSADRRLAPPQPTTTVVRHASPPEPVRTQDARRPSASRIVHALSSGRSRLSSDHVRATARANKAVLDAYARDDVHVHVVRMSYREATRLFESSDLRTRVVPLNQPGGATRLKLVRLSKSGWMQRVGLQPGDVLVRVNGQLLTTPQKTVEIYQEAEQAKHVVLEVVRDGHVHVFSVSWNG